MVFRMKITRSKRDERTTKPEQRQKPEDVSQGSITYALEECESATDARRYPIVVWRGAAAGWRLEYRKKSCLVIVR